MLQSRIIAEGNIGQDLQVVTRIVKGEERQVVNVSIANVDRILVDGTWQDNENSQIWVEAGIWGPMADNVAATFKRGDRVVLMGENFTVGSWEKDGKSGVNYHLKGSTECLPSLRWATAKIAKNEKSAPASASSPASSGNVVVLEGKAYRVEGQNLVPLTIASTPASSAETPADAPF